MIDPLLIQRFAEAIAAMEGYYKPSSLSARNNNPGNLRSWGRLPRVNGYASFPTPDAGWAALRRQITLNISRGLTTREFFCGKPGVYAGFAPACDANDPDHYATFIADKLGISPDTPLQTALATLAIKPEDSLPSP